MTVAGYHHRKGRSLAHDSFFGEQESQDWNKEDIDWNAIDSQLISKHIVISRPEINGQKTRLFTSAQQLWHQHQPCDAQRGTTTCHTGADPPTGRPADRGGRSQSHRECGKKY